MRFIPVVVLAFCVTSVSLAQAPEVKPRFDVLHNSELYKQDTPKDTLNAVVGAIARDRYDYVLAHLLDPAFVNARLLATQSYFERIAAEQIAASASGRILKGADLQARIQQVGTTLNVKQLADQLKQKIAEEPDNLKDLKRFAREGQFMDSGDTAVATLKDVKDRAIHFKKVEGRWFMENKKDEKSAPKE